MNQKRAYHEYPKKIIWMIVPILKNGHCVGIIKLITYRESLNCKMLRHASLGICEAFADYIYAKYQKELPVRSLQNLNEFEMFQESSTHDK